VQETCKRTRTTVVIESLYLGGVAPQKTAGENVHLSLAIAFQILALVLLPALAIVFAVATGKLNRITWRSLRAGQRRKLANNLEWFSSVRSFMGAAMRFAKPVAAVAVLALAVFTPMAFGFAKVLPSPKLSPQQINAMQRQSVLANSVEMTQQVYSATTASLAAGNVLQVAPRNVGLIKKFIIEVTGTVTTSAGDALTLTDFGVANLLSNVQFTDLNNNVRVNTSGWHLSMIAGYKKRFPLLGAAGFGSVGTSVQNGLGGGSPVFAVVSAPPTIGASTTGAVRFVYEVPLAYNDDDLRGAIYANVVNATMNLQITINSASLVQNTADTTLAVYSDSQAVPGTTTLNTVTVTVYQVYLDQLPFNNGRPVLPILDLSTVYELKSTSLTGLVVGQEFPMPYANFRDFMSTCAIYNNTAGSAGRTAGTDVSYFALQSANFTNIWKKDPLLAAQHAREILKADFAKGVYYFSHRRKPISTTQYGNMELILNPSTVGAANAYVLIGWEDFALVNTLTQAGSLAG
jgi:hypothetical protein